MVALGHWLADITTESLALQGGDGEKKFIRYVSFNVFWRVPWRVNL